MRGAEGHEANGLHIHKWKDEKEEEKEEQRGSATPR